MSSLDVLNELEHFDELDINRKKGVIIKIV